MPHHRRRPCRFSAGATGHHLLATTTSTTLRHRRSCLPRSRNRERRGAYPNLRVTQRYTHADSNIGTRDRLPLCDSNPNRVKETEKGPGVAEVTGTPVTTATAREKCRTDTARKNRSGFGSKKKKSGFGFGRTLRPNPNFNPIPNRVNPKRRGKKGKESVSGKKNSEPNSDEPSSSQSESNPKRKEIKEKKNPKKE